uniref:Uncharacterized protein n=1 Tax=Tetranychus urticae TaxID=32264 RepID=T1JYZ5_TETUR
MLMIFVDNNCTHKTGLTIEGDQEKGGGRCEVITGQQKNKPTAN